MDENVTLKAQLEEDIGPVVVLNKFTIKPEDTDEFLKIFATTTEEFKRQPGFISAQLHQSAFLVSCLLYFITTRNSSSHTNINIVK